MIELTDEQRQELDGPDVRVRDPKTQTTYVLVREDVFTRLMALLTPDDIDFRVTAEHLDRVMAADDALDPHLAEYQRRYGGRQ